MEVVSLIDLYIYSAGFVTQQPTASSRLREVQPGLSLMNLSLSCRECKIKQGSSVYDILQWDMWNGISLLVRLFSNSIYESPDNVDVTKLSVATPFLIIIYSRCSSGNIFPEDTPLHNPTGCSIDCRTG
jgi:hypothetical protein